MLAKCLNPACSAQFQYLGKGRLFRIEFERNDACSSRGERPFEYFWLCAECAATMTVVLDKGGKGHAVTRPATATVPLPLSPDTPRHVHVP